MDSVIVRECSNDFDALQIANAMQSMDHVEVFSIVFQDWVRGRWLVFAKYAKEKVSPEQIDAVITRGHMGL